MTEPIVLSTPEEIHRFRIHAIEKGLEIEIRTVEAFGNPNNFLTRGMALRAARQELKYKGRLTRRRALTMMRETFSDILGDPSRAAHDATTQSSSNDTQTPRDAQGS